MAQSKTTYPVSLEIDYPPKSNRLTALFRIFLVIPVSLILTILTSSVADMNASANGETNIYSYGIIGSLFSATAIMILFRQRYPKWWYSFNLELNRFSARIGAYLFLLTDKYPSTEDEQSVHLNIEFPDVKKDLNRWMPLVKWFLAIPHYIALSFLGLVAIVGTLVAWVTILVTGKYPKEIFNFVVGVNRWSYRVLAYMFLLTTDKYPPFSLK